jgi:hypothetical protein
MHYLAYRPDETTDTTAGKSEHTRSFVIPFWGLVLFAVFMLIMVASMAHG